MTACDMKRIKSLKVISSNFFVQDFHVEFSEKLNCIMGGRGTGKSTLLEFLYACTHEDAEANRTTLSILQSNLEGGTIELELCDEDGVNFRIEKTLGQPPQAYQHPDLTFHSIDTIESRIRCDIFRAQHIEEIGRNSEERLKLIDRMIADEIQKLNFQVKNKQNELSKNASDLRSINFSIKDASERLNEFQSVDEDLKKLLGEKPEGIDEKERSEIEAQESWARIRGFESRYFETILQKVEDYRQSLAQLKNEFADSKAAITSADQFVNSELVEKFNSRSTEALVNASESISLTLEKFSETSDTLRTLITQLKTIHSEQDNVFIQLKNKINRNREYYERQSKIRKRQTDRDLLNNEIHNNVFAKNKFQGLRTILMKELNALQVQIYDARLAKINLLNGIFSKGRIKITLAMGGIKDKFEDLLRNALKGRKIQYNSLIPAITKNLQPALLGEIVHQQQDGRLSALTGIENSKAKMIVEALHDSEAIYEIESLICPDLPNFHLKIEKTETQEDAAAAYYKQSDFLSTGQRCTAVLPVVFAISDNPLIIDQPEDNLDNRYISETIREILLTQKEKRQLIFITHNPNIPVLSDSEKNIFLEFNEMKSSILKEGNVEEVKEEILSLLEGGKEAFEQRNILYGPNR